MTAGVAPSGPPGPSHGEASARKPRKATPYKLATLAAAAVLCLALAGLRGPHGVVEGYLLDALVTLRAALAPPVAPPVVSQAVADGDAAESAQTEPVAVVALDIRSLSAPDLATIPRALMQKEYARLVEALFAAEARSLAFDFIFAFRGGGFIKDWDKPLQTAFKANAGRVVLGRDGGMVPHVAYWGPLANQPPGRLGVAELVPDRDGIIRRVNTRYWVLPPVEEGEGPVLGLDPLPDAKTLLTLNGAALARAGETDFAHQVLLTPRVHLERIPTYSFIDVLRCAEQAPEVVRAVFKDKVVFFGSTLPGEDRKWTSARFLPPMEDAQAPAPPHPCGLAPRPASNAEVLSVPGVHVHAAAARAILTGTAPRPVNEATRLALSVLAAVGAGGAVLFLPLVQALPLVVVGLVALAAASLAALAAGVWLPAGLPLVQGVVVALASYSVRYLLEERQHRKMRDAFSRYVAPQLVQKIAEDEATLDRGGEVRDITVWIADIANYSTMSQDADPKEVVRMLNKILGSVAERVEAHGGYVTHYAGDAIVATFNTFGTQEDHADRGVLSALDCRRVALEKAAEMGRAEGEDRIDLRLGISSDRMLVGNIGAATRMNFTVIGDGINLSARLESANKIFGTRILVSDNTRERCSDALVFRLVDRVRVKGRSHPVLLYEPLGRVGTSDPAALDIKARYEAALAAYWNREFTTARGLLEALAERDPPARVLLPRVIAAAEAPPAESWDRVYDLPTK